MEQNPFTLIHKLERDLERVKRVVGEGSGSGIAATIGDAKGDLIGFSAADTPVRIPAAAGNGYIVTSDTSQPGGVGWAPPTTMSAVQNAQVGMTGFIDVPGCSLTLTPGIWIVSSKFTSARIWHNGVSANAWQEVGGAVTDGSGTVLQNNYFWATLGADNVHHRIQMPGVDLTTIINTTVNYTIKMRCYATMVSGTNSLGGWRWDSGLGHPCSMYAMRLR